MILDAAQQRAADAVLDREARKRRHLVVSLSGAHAYGFPSPDSDLDLKAVHIAPTRALLGLGEPERSADFLEVMDGIEIDYTSNEIGMVLAGVLQGNGNYLERILSAIPLRTSSEHASLRPLVQDALSRRMWRHYAGFAKNQLDAVRSADEPAAKSVLYVLRTALTGTHALLTGELVTDVGLLIDEHGFGHARALIEKKRAGERTLLSPSDKEAWLSDLERLLALLEQARGRSCLPEEPQNRDALEEWLVRIRQNLG